MVLSEGPGYPCRIITSSNEDKSQKGNFSEYLKKMDSLYSKILKQGKDLFVYGNNPAYVVALAKKERKEDSRGLILDYNDVNEMNKMFPLPNEVKDYSEIIKNSRIKPYTGKEHNYFSEKPIDVSDLEAILENGSILIYSDLQ